MSAWKPTDEQRAAISEWWTTFDGPAFPTGELVAEELTASPAFQSIIRAAQAEALRGIADEHQYDAIEGHSDWLVLIRHHASEIEARS